jgi:cytochrome c2
MRTLFLAMAGFCICGPLVFGGDAGKGKELFRACASCHNYETDVRKTGPSLRTLFGKVTLRNGQRVNEDNVRALILEGYNRMPSYRYQFRPNELDDLVAFLKTLNARPLVAVGDPVSAGKEVFRGYCSRCHNFGSTETKPAGDLKGLFGREKLANGEALTEANVLILVEEGHGGMAGTKKWLDEPSVKALFTYLKRD